MEGQFALSGNKQNLAIEFSVMARELSDLQCLMNTLSIPPYFFVIAEILWRVYAIWS